MQAEERARAIVERVRGDGFQAIEALALQFGVTPQTIRRDVNLLCDRGLLRRRHGGVELPPEGENLAYPDERIVVGDIASPPQPESDLYSLVIGNF